MAYYRIKASLGNGRVYAEGATTVDVIAQISAESAKDAINAFYELMAHEPPLTINSVIGDGD